MNDMRRFFNALLVTIGVLLSSGCAYNASYNQAYFGGASSAYQDKITGVAAIEVPAETRGEFLTSSPTSYTGSATKLTLPVGEIVTQASLLSFKEIFTGGAEIVQPGKYNSSHTIIVRPKFRSMTYEYNSLKNVGFAITPTASVSVEISVESSSQRNIINKVFDSGPVEGPAYFATGAPGDEISKAFHQASISVTRRAADEIYKTFKSLPKGLGSAGNSKEDEL